MSSCTTSSRSRIRFYILRGDGQAAALPIRTRAAAMVQLHRSLSIGTVTAQHAINHAADKGNAIAGASTVAIARAITVAIAIAGTAVVDRPTNVATAISTAAVSGHMSAATAVSGDLPAAVDSRHMSAATMASAATMTMGS